MGTLVDTGVLLRAIDANFSGCRQIRKALRRALEINDPLFVAVQNIAEFWNVATRPLEYNGQGLTGERTKRRVLIIERLCQVLSEDVSSYEEWKRLVDELGVSGVKVHDARLIAVMKSRGIGTLLTLNENDFRRYAGEGIAVKSPESYCRDVSSP
jgi:predicted nucleic acid-binding protein